jgi:hypothetical protein
VTLQVRGARQIDSAIKPGLSRISQLDRGIQIPVAPAARPYIPLGTLSSTGGFPTLAAGHAAPPSSGRHPKPFTKNGKSQFENNNSASRSTADVAAVGTVHLPRPVP